MKRKVPVPVAKDILSRVPFQVSFWLCTNENLRGLSDVSEALQKATDDVFRYHVNRDKNDFEVWIRDVIKDKDLAREIARVKTRETLIRKISERVEELRSLVKRSIRQKPKSRQTRPGSVAKRLESKVKRKAKPRRRQKAARRSKRKLQRKAKSRMTPLRKRSTSRSKPTVPSRNSDLGIGKRNRRRRARRAVRHALHRRRR